MNIQCADRMKGVKMSRIREMLTKCNELQREGVDLATFTVGQPDFDTPQYIKEACYQALEEGYTGYAETPGSKELHEAICRKLKRDNNLDYEPDEISVTVGAAQAAYLGIMTFLNPGDEILVPDPAYNIYESIPQIAGAVVKHYELREENEFQIDLEQLAGLITDKTKMIVMLTPNNPIGSALTRENLQGVADLICDKDILVLSDEVYERLGYDEEIISIAALPGMKEHTLVMNGMSKAYSMTGWRIGWLAAPKELLEPINILSFNMVSCGNNFVQRACITALDEEGDAVETMRQEFKRRRDYIIPEINKLNHFSALMPKGAFYVFMNITKTGMSSEEFSNMLLEEYRCSSIPGNVFGKMGEGFIRLSYASSMENLQRLAKALEEIDKKLG